MQMRIRRIKKKRQRGPGLRRTQFSIVDLGYLSRIGNKPETGLLCPGDQVEH